MEILKLFSIILIILSHVIQTLNDPNEFVPYQDYLLNLGQSTTNFSLLVLAVFRYSGEFGNTIFFLCSAWFLLDRETSSKKKVFYLLADVFTVSVCIFIPVIILRKGDLGIKMIIKSFFPTLFANNWYITCYILFSLLYFARSIGLGSGSRSICISAMLMSSVGRSSWCSLSLSYRSSSV